MSYKVRTIENFDRQAKKLAKHYESFRKDFEKFLDELSENPLMGKDLGGGIRKARMAITSKGKGKSGGARVITYTADVFIHSNSGEIVLLSIYDKSKRSSISDKEIKLLKESILS
ncbi:MAG: type II toxin-antitoxin system RelE/ParE family toxin [Prevotella sp.]|nr:type II toxin-antitoxin system RelE/ParE family toxin [Prevotella sp.]